MDGRAMLLMLSILPASHLVLVSHGWCLCHLCAAICVWMIPFVLIPTGTGRPMLLSTGSVSDARLLRPFPAPGDLVVYAPYRCPAATLFLCLVPSLSARCCLCVCFATVLLTAQPHCCTVPPFTALLCYRTTGQLVQLHYDNCSNLDATGPLLPALLLHYRTVTSLTLVLAG